MEHKTDTFTFNVASKPDLINVDGDKYLLWEKKDNKPLSEFVHQFKYAKNFVDRREAIDYCAKHKNEAAAFALLKDALNDPYFKLRNRSLLAIQDTTLDAATINKIEAMAKSDTKSYCRSYAINALAKTKDKKYLPLYLKAVYDSSYTVAASALEAIAALDEEKAVSLLPALKKDSKGALKVAVNNLDVLTKGDKDFDEMTNNFSDIKDLQGKFNALGTYITYLTRVNNTANFKKGVDLVVAFRNKVAQYGVAPQINAMLSGIIIEKKEAAKAKGANAADMDEQIKYVKEQAK